MAAPLPLEQQFSDEKKKQIIEMYQGGKTQKEIGEFLNLPRRTIMKLLKKLKVEVRSNKEAQKSRFDPGFLKEVKKLRGRGRPMTDIARLLNRSVSSIHRACKKLGLSKLDITYDEEGICRLYRDGINMNTVAKKFNISSYIVKQILIKNNVSLRPALVSGFHKIKASSIELPTYVDSIEWYKDAYKKYGMSSIAKFVGRSIGFVGHKLEKYGIKKLSISERMTTLDRQVIMSAYEGLGSMSKVASRFNCSVQAIKNILQEKDIKPRTTSEILSGEGNPFYGKHHPEEVKQYCTEIGSIHGKKFWEEHPEYVEVVRKKQKELWSDLTRRQADSEMISRLIKEGKCNSKRGKIRTRFGEMAFDSSYETALIEFCEDEKRVVHLERDFDLVEYKHNKTTKYFIPDFRVWLSNGDFLVIEVKSIWLAKQDKERQKIMAGFGKFADKFMIVDDIEKKSFVEVKNRIDTSFEPIDFNFDELELRDVGPELYSNFYSVFHYMGRSGRKGPTIGAFLGNRLIAACTISSITRGEIAQKQGLTQSEMRELVRFCIHPDFHKDNFGSWFLSRAVSIYSKKNPTIKKLVSFADSTQGHAGTIYKASNWTYDGDTLPSYHYEDSKQIRIHKKTVYDQAAKLGLCESEHASNCQLQKVRENIKHRYLKDL